MSVKINRLIEIATILLNRKMITAAELAERFGVSTRTIYRDIDVLSGSGVPVFCTQGREGGISILEDYTLNRTALSETESDNIIFALQSLKATKYPQIDAILDKLGALFKSSQNDWISIDFTPWGANPNEFNKFNMIKNAIMCSKVIELDYINANNCKSHRKAAPLRLIFKSQAWYLWSFCFERQDFRIFRISRIKNTVISDETFERGSLVARFREQDEKPVEDHPLTHLVLQFSETALYRLYDDYDEDMLRKNKDGSYTLEIDFPEDDWAYGYILSFGPNVKVIEPKHIRNIIKEKSKIVVGYYE